MASSTSKIKLDSVRTLFGGIWDLYKRRFAVAFQVVALPVLLRLLAYVLGGIAGMQVASVIVIIIWWFASLISSVALISAVGRGTSLDESYRLGFRLFWPALFLGILAFFITLGGFIMLVVPGIILIIWLGFANYVLVLEGRRGFRALMQSRAYVRGYSWPVFWRMVLFFFVAVVLAIFIGIISALIFGVFLAGLAIELLLAPFAVAFAFKLYENLRALKPDVAAQLMPGAGRDFLVVSMIVGIVVLACLLVLGIFFGPRLAASFQNRYPAATSIAPGVPKKLQAGGPGSV